MSFNNAILRTIMDSADDVANTNKKMKLLSTKIASGTVWINNTSYDAKDIFIDYATPGDDKTICSFACEGIITGTATLVGEGTYGGCTFMMPPSVRCSRLSHQEMRLLRKKFRDKKSKETLRQIASNPMLAEQDRRKLKRIGRRYAEHLQRALGIKVT